MIYQPLFAFLLILIVSIIFEILVFLYPLDSFNFDPPPGIQPSINLIDYNVNLMTIAGLLMGGLLLSVLLLLGFGFLYKAF